MPFQIRSLSFQLVRSVLIVIPCYLLFLLMGCNVLSGPPKLTLTTSGANSSYGSAVTFSAKVSPDLPGTITFYDAGVPIGTGVPSGTIASFTTSALATGVHTITSSWRGSLDYASAISNQVTQAVSKSKPTITWAAPKPIIVGTALSSTQLDATANVPGTFDYTPALGVVTSSGLQTLSATFTPSDSTNYDSAMSRVSLSVIGAKPGQIAFTFTLPVSAQTSAGVYDSSGNLVRTLWSNRQYPAGSQTAYWDGNDDSGSPRVAALYEIRTLYNNVNYTWGVIGDTTASWAGPATWDALSILPSDMAVIGNNAYVTDNYAEGRPNAATFNLTQPQVPSPLFGVNVCVYLQEVTTDGNLLYFVNTGSGWSGDNSYVMAFDPAAHKYYKFSAGVPATDCGAQILSGVIDLAVSSTTDSRSGLNPATGIAVQRKSNILAVAHGANGVNTGQNLIRLFNKTSGAPMGGINISNPQRMAFEPDGSLWVISDSTVVQITSVGSANILGTTLPGLSAPQAISVDPSNGNVLVTDGGSSQQVKTFSEGGTLLTTYGDPGGMTDCDPTVSKTRLFLDYAAGAGWNYASGYWTTAFVAVMPDSSYWFGDPGNARVIHISSTGQYIEQISFLRFLYFINADHGDPSRVFAGLLEYDLNYNVPMVPGDADPAVGGNGAWTLAKNWSVCLAGFNPATNTITYSQRFNSVQTFANGHTYALVLNWSGANVAPGGPYTELAELPVSGPLRLSGKITEAGPWVFPNFDHAGNLSWWNNTQSVDSTAQVAYLQPLMGYGNDDWPVWGAVQALASVPYELIWPKAGAPQSNDPSVWGGWGMNSFPLKTTGGFYPTYNANVGLLSGSDHHLGAVLAGGTDWAWKASPGADLTVPDEQGTFNDNGGYGGHDGIAVFVEGSNVFEGYDGQWGSYASQWMHWNEDGLLIGQFGKGFNNYPGDGSLILEAAGNIETMTTVSVGSNIYLYNSDEGNHPGIHQWKITGLDSIHELRGLAPLGGTVTLQ
jgi:hypothetical protein